uniref:Uncharacterized protein n=1 Tax=Aegilops tauschii subsp. strangulata TaxID=200361 RepID=A0A453A0N9_AEGTS
PHKKIGRLPFEDPGFRLLLTFWMVETRLRRQDPAGLLPGASP